MTKLEQFHLFFLFFILFSSIFLILSRNPVYSVLFLILIFFCSAASVILVGVDFIGLLFIIIYVGAIAVLFLFIVMMLDLKIERSSLQDFLFEASALLFILITVVAIITLKSGNDFNSFDEYFSLAALFVNNLDPLFNIDVFGQCLFNYFIPCFLIAGLILLVAMLGAIALTLKYAAKKKNQTSSRQLSRKHKFLSYYS
jgi:NADH-quinone oxidoreductase subunit J